MRRSIREGGPDINVAEAVANGRADFGVCSASILREWRMGRRLVVLAAIFQHSPAVILVARRADIRSVSELRGRTLMDAPGSDEIAAMLKQRADVMVAYSGESCSRRTRFTFYPVDPRCFRAEAISESLSSISESLSSMDESLCSTRSIRACCRSRRALL
jgi:NMT1/THI5 like